MLLHTQLVYTTKAIALAGLVSLLSLSSTASSPIDHLSDTSRKISFTGLDKTNSSIVVIQEANVVFPEILAGNEEKSISYIEKFSSTRKSYLINTYNRGKKLFPKAETILKKYNVPLEFKVLLALESGFNANAISSAGAVGYWQFMDEVAREYGLKIASKVKVDKKGKHAKSLAKNKKQVMKLVGADDRKNFNKSTHAAARYLKDRGRNLDNDWLLIAASYNCGVGNVWNAMERCGKKSPDFWDIKKYLPAETQAYVMNFITLNVIFNNYEAFTKNALCFKDVICVDESTEMEEDISNTSVSSINN
jgi:membrane-bound lytic murein transglycosylase MltF